MAIISSKKQPQEPEKKSKQRRQSGSRPQETLLQPQADRDELRTLEQSIRPQSFADYIGQKDLKEVLDIAIKAAKARGETLDHLLL